MTADQRLGLFLMVLSAVITVAAGWLVLTALLLVASR